MAGRFSKRRKFHAKWTPDSEGVKHPSEGEARWFDRLLMRQRGGDIRELERRPTYEIRIARDCPTCAAAGEVLCDIEFDAAFVDREGVRRVVDYKGIEGNTPLSKLKRLLVKLRYGVDAEIVGPAREKENRERERKAFEKEAKRRAKHAGQPDLTLAGK